MFFNKVLGIIFGILFTSSFVFRISNIQKNNIDLQEKLINSTHKYKKIEHELIRIKMQINELVESIKINEPIE